jgi:hypothetical protein
MESVSIALHQLWWMDRPPLMTLSGLSLPFPDVDCPGRRDGRPFAPLSKPAIPHLSTTVAFRSD